ncbi:MAG TPA: hypothetical protein VGG06_28905 [Thermoanaerobaculia bacterium]|jgi:hypothetical protein
MNGYLAVAAVVSFLLAPLHSFLGEWLIFGELMLRKFPPILGSEALTRRTVRYFWHLIGVFWWGFAAVLWRCAAMPDPDPTARWTAGAIAWIFLVSSISAFVATRGRHFAWLLFLAIAVLTWLGLR